LSDLDLEPREYSVKGRKEPIFHPGGLRRLILPAVLFCIAVAFVYYRDNPLPF
jgi:hypothetical protein